MYFIRIAPSDEFQYFAKVEKVPKNRGAKRVYARSAPLFSGFSQPYRDTEFG